MRFLAGCCLRAEAGALICDYLSCGGGRDSGGGAGIQIIKSLGNDEADGSSKHREVE